MRAMRADEKAHVAAVGEPKFNSALAKATMVVRMDGRLTGLDKLREPLAYQAAMEATGFERRGFTIGKKEIPPDCMAICEELLEKAREAATPQ